MMNDVNNTKIRVRHNSSTDSKEVFDVVRKVWVAYTPEEHVRQVFLWYMIHKKGYPAELISVEYPFMYSNNKFRADIVMFDSQSNPLILIECKAESVFIDKKVLDQCSLYNSHIKARYVIATNLKKTYCFFTDDFVSYSKCNIIPSYDDIIKE